MNLSKILLDETIPIGNIRTSVTDDWLEYSPHVQARVDAVWAEKVRESTSLGSALWDGNNYRLMDYDFEDGILTLRMGYVKYRNVSFRLFPEELRKEIRNRTSNEPGSGLFVAALAHTNDGYYIFGERSARHLNSEGRITVLGGTLQPDDRAIESAEDIAESLYKELHEEAGIEREHIKKTHLAGIVRGRNGNIGLIFSAAIDRTCEEVWTGFLHHNDLEMKDLVFVPAHSVVEQLDEMGERNYTLKLYASLLASRRS